MTDDSRTHSSAKAETERRKPLWVYLKQCAAHLWLGIRALWPFWVLAVCPIVFFWDCPERDIRFLGMFLQLVGFLTVAKGLRPAFPK